MIERALSGELDQDKKSRDGEYYRREAARITGLPERSGRRVLNDVVAEGLLASATQKGPVSLRFPTDSLEIFFPGFMCRLNAAPQFAMHHGSHMSFLHLIVTKANGQVSTRQKGYS